MIRRLVEDRVDAPYEQKVYGGNEIFRDFSRPGDDVKEKDLIPELKLTDDPIEIQIHDQCSNNATKNIATDMHAPKKGPKYLFHASSLKWIKIN